MNRDHWQQIDEFFQAAVELEPGKRAAFLDEACAGDPALRGRVEAMLAADADEWDLIDSPALEVAAVLVADDHPQLVSGQQIAHYEIVSLIGKGGMGEVYLAKDQTLNRRVALKLLPVDYTTDKDRLRRFQQEAHAASALNHPNILTIHELGLTDGQQFIAIEFVEGETLRQRMNRGALSLREVIDIAVQTAGALAAAHQAEIVHRDIKPENIMLRPDGYVKVLDFGLAKLTQQSERRRDAQIADKLDTSSGLVMGTVKYMSPEQARGLPVDPRSDIFSLGVLLYEMVAGYTPFKGETAGELIESILKDEPTSLAQSLPATPDRLAHIVSKALGKKRSARYQTTNDLLTDLKALKEELDLESKLQVSRPQGPPTGLDGEADRSPALTERLWYTSAASISEVLRRVAKHKTVSAIVLIALMIGAVSIAYLPLKRRSPSLGTWAAKAAIPTPRGGAAVAALNGELYVATGFNESGSTDAFEVYDPATDKWSSKAPVPTARAYAGAAGIDGKVYVFGGCGNNREGNLDCRTSTTNVLEAYDSATNMWVSKTPMPTARSHMASTVIGGKLYVAGGRGPCPPCGVYNKLEVYDPATDTWDITRAPMPTGRVCAGGAAIKGKFYVAGGEYAGTLESALAQPIAVYDPANDNWALGASMPTPRNGLGVEALHGILYAISGVNAITESNVVETYDPASNEWTTKAPIPTPRMYLQPVAINGMIYVVGGGGSRNLPLSTLEAYTAVCPGSTCISAPPGLVGWWPGDGDANDIAGSNKGMLQGSVTFEAGKVDHAFRFDGSSFVTMGNPAALNLTGNRFTIGGWINPSVNGPAVYFGKTEYGLNDYVLLFSRGLHGLIRTDGNESVVFGYSDFPSNTRLLVPPIRQWTHIALTYDGSVIKLYANGELVGQERKTGDINSDSVPFNIGGRADDNGTGKFNGLIDEVEVFDRALSQKEIHDIFDAGSAGTCKPRRNCQ
jgi:serine/threonine protein kinase/N-acetylneuraminic acid mutarotase